MNLIRAGIAKLLKLEESFPYATGHGNLDDAENLGWSPLTQRGKDLPTYHVDYSFKVADFLYRRNPIAHRIIEVTKAFVVGEGIHVKARNEKVDEVLQAFWRGRRNNWRRWMKERVMSLSIYGEAIYPVAVNPVNGAVIIGNSAPIIIKQIDPNPRNTYEPMRVIFKAGKTADGQDIPEQAHPIIALDTDIDSNTFGMLNGDFFFWSINHPMDTLRGSSDIYSIADWLDIYDQFLFNRAEKQAYMNAFLWDITMEGYSQKKMDEFLARLLLFEKKKETGKYFVHNDKVQRKAIAPDLNSDDASKDAESFMNMIHHGSGLSGQAFGVPGSAGRQNNSDMNEWVYKTLSDRQYTWRDFLLEIFDFVVDMAVLKGTLTPEQGRDRYIDIFMPKISMRDLQRVTQALRNIGGFISSVTKSEESLQLTDRDKKQLKDTYKVLLDHVDQSISPDLDDLVSLTSGDKLSAEKIRASQNGKQEVAMSEKVEEADKAVITEIKTVTSKQVETLEESKEKSKQKV